MCIQVETSFAPVARPPSIAGLLCPPSPKPKPLPIATERCQCTCTQDASPFSSSMASSLKLQTVSFSTERRKRIAELELKREHAIRRCQLEQIHCQRVAERKVWLSDCSDYLYKRPKLALMFVEAAATVFAGRRDRLMMWSFEQYETYIAYNVPLPPLERARWLVAVAIRTAHPLIELMALCAEEYAEPEPSGPASHVSPVAQRHVPAYARRTETPLLQRVLINNMMTA